MHLDLSNPVSNIFKIYPFPAPVYLLSYFQLVDSSNELPMTGFKLQISVVESNRSNHCATIIRPSIKCVPQFAKPSVMVGIFLG